jgi:hypothetical protein
MTKPKKKQPRVKVGKLQTLSRLAKTKQKKVKGGAFADGSVRIIGDGSVRFIKDGTSNT